VDVAAAVGMPMAPSDFVHVDCGGRRAGAVARKSFRVGPGDVELVSEVDSSVDDIACSPDQVSPLCLDKIMVRCLGPFVEDIARSGCLVFAMYPDTAEIPAWLECQAMGARESVREILLQRRQVPQVLRGVCEAEQRLPTRCAKEFHEGSVCQRQSCPRVCWQCFDDEKEKLHGQDRKAASVLGVVFSFDD